MDIKRYDYEAVFEEQGRESLDIIPWVKEKDHLQVVKELEEDIEMKDKLIFEHESTLEFAEKQRKSLRSQIEGLKCCGNCFYYEDLCITCETCTRHDGWTKNVELTDNWQSKDQD